MKSLAGVFPHAWGSLKKARFLAAGVEIGKFGMAFGAVEILECVSADEMRGGMRDKRSCRDGNERGDVWVWIFWGSLGEVGWESGWYLPMELFEGSVDEMRGMQDERVAASKGVMHALDQVLEYKEN